MTRLPRVLLIALAGVGLSACSLVMPVSPADDTPPPAPPSASASASMSASAQPTETTTASPAASATVDPAAIVLRGDGIGVYAFGAKEADVTALLESKLGKAKSSYQGIRCEFDSSSPWTRNLSWGSLWVEYAAKDRSRKSPRTLAAWGFAADAKLPEAVSTQDGVSPNLTFSQLKQKYPKGKMVDLTEGYGALQFILPNKIFFVGSGNTPDRMQAGDFSACE